MAISIYKKLAIKFTVHGDMDINYDTYDNLLKVIPEHLHTILNCYQKSSSDNINVTISRIDLNGDPLYHMEITSIYKGSYDLINSYIDITADDILYIIKKCANNNFIQWQFTDIIEND